MAKVNPIQLQKYLKGANYPMALKDIITLAKKNGADTNIMDALQKLPEKQYESPVSITKEIGKLE